MTTLFTPPTETQASEGEKPKWTDSVRQGAVLGASFFGGGSVIYSMVDLLKSEPDKGFSLLKAWGPWCILTGLSLSVLYMLAMALIRARAESDARMAAAFDRLAIGQERVATATEAAAAKDDRQLQQLEVLQTTMVMKLERVIRHLHGQDRALERLEDNAGINRPQQDGEESDQ